MQFVSPSIGLPVLASAPGSPVEGDLYYDSSLSKVRVYTLAGWVNIPGAGGGASVTNWLQSQTPAIALSPVNTITLNKPLVNPAFLLTPTTPVITIPQNPAFQFQTPTATVTAAKPPLNPAPQLNVVATNNEAASEIPAQRILQAKFDLTHRSGSNAVTQVAFAGRTDWLNLANAQGIHDATSASLSANLSSGQGGRLKLAYADFPNKSSLTITTVKMYIYAQSTGTMGATDGIVFYSWDGTTETAQLTKNGLISDFNFLTTPFVADVSSTINTWAKLDAFEARIDAILAIASLASFSVDAIELEVIATATQIF